MELFEQIRRDREREGLSIRELACRHGVRQLDFYVDEFVFRFNRRHSGSRGLLFYRLLEQAVQVDHVPAREIVGGRHGS